MIYLLVVPLLNCCRGSFFDSSCLASCGGTSYRNIPEAIDATWEKRLLVLSNCCQFCFHTVITFV